MGFEEVKLYAQVAGVVLMVVFYLVAYALKRSGDDIYVDGWVYGATIIGVLLPISIAL